MGDKEVKSPVSSLLSWIVRFVLVAIVLGITAFLTPGFSIVGLAPLILAAVVITGLDYLTERVLGIDASPFGRGIKGFIIAAVIIYIAQYIVPNMAVTVMGAIIAAFVIGIIDAILPGRVM